MSQPADIQPHSIEEILKILRNQAIAMPASSTSSRYLRALESLESSLPPHQLSDKSDSSATSQRAPLADIQKDTAATAADTEPSAPILRAPLANTFTNDRSSLIIHHLSLSLTDWLVNQWLMNAPFATASLYLDIISSLYGSAVKANLLPPTKLFSQLKAALKALGPQGWKSGIDDEIFARALRLTKNAAHLVADDATAAAMVIWSLTHSLMSLTDIALLKKSDISSNTAPSGGLSQGNSQNNSSLIVNRSSLSPNSDDNNSSLIVNRSSLNPDSDDNNSSFIIHHLSLNRSRYAFPLRQSQRTPKQLQSHINNIVNALFSRARLPQATDPYQTVEALWTYAALRAGIPASILVSHLGHAPLGLPVLKLCNTAAKAADTEPSAPILRAPLADTFTNHRSSSTVTPTNSSLIINNLSLIGKIFLENPPQWFAMSLRPGVRFTQVCRRIQLLLKTEDSRLKTQNSLSDIKLFYPCEEIARAIGKKIVTRQRPFIHSVVFFRAKLTDIGRLFSRIGDLAWCYRQSARPGAPYAHISDAQFRLFQQTIAQFTPDYEVASAGELEIKEGDRVEILGGLFTGHEAIMERRLPSRPPQSEPGTRKTLNDNTAHSANTAAEAADTARSADTPATPSVVYRLHIVGDNGIEWRIHLDPRLLMEQRASQPAPPSKASDR